MIKLVTTIIGTYLNIVNFFFPKLGGKQAFFTFCYPFKAKITEKQQTFLDTAELKTIVVKGQHVPLYRWGNGKRKVLFVHGWQSNAYRWKRYIDRLDKNEFTIYAFDAPGHGNSKSKYGNVPLYAESLHQISLQIGKVETFITHSLGGFASFYFFHLYPNFQPKKLLALASPTNANQFVDVFSSTIGLSKKAIKNISAYFIEYAGKPVSFFHVNNFMENIDIEGLIIHDTKDKDVGIDNAHVLHIAWPEANLMITDGLGHRLLGNDVLNTVTEYVKQSPQQINGSVAKNLNVSKH